MTEIQNAQLSGGQLKQNDSPHRLMVESAPAGGTKKELIVAITSCPTGIAHTFMAAEGLEQAAKALGYDIRVETQGSVGAGTPLTPEEISRAALVLIAADKEVERSRFVGKRVFAAATKPAITAGEALIRQASLDRKSVV